MTRRHPTALALVALPATFLAAAAHARLRIVRRILVALGLCFLCTEAANAQQPGDLLWAVEIDGFTKASQPVVAADGTIYIHTNAFYAISPVGQILWSKPIDDTNAVDVGADGTVYAGSENTIYAYRPDGTLKWSFTESPGVQGLFVGPTVGPDGSIYAATDVGGLGAFALTPEGALQWNVTDYGDRTIEHGPVQFGPNNVYIAEDIVPLRDGCTELSTGLTSVSLSGEFEWCVPISGTSRTVATADGKALVWQADLQGKTLFAYDATGQLVWSHTFAFSPQGIGDVTASPDHNIYLWHGPRTAASLTEGGEVRWEREQDIGSFALRPVLGPNEQVLVAGTPYGSDGEGGNGEIFAMDAADGRLLWKTSVTGLDAGVNAPAAFSADGSVAYVPVETESFGVPNELWAVYVQDVGPPEEIALSLDPVAPPIVIPAGGGSFQADLSITNTGSDTARVQIWLTIGSPDGRDIERGPYSADLPAGREIAKRLTQSLPAEAPAGEYTYTGYVGTYPEPVEVSDGFTFEKAADAARSTARATAGRTLSGFDVTEAELPSAFALHGAYPNPFNPTTTIGYDLPESAHVRLAVYDVLGRRVALLVDGREEAGAKRVVFDAAALPSGMYLYRLETGGRVETRQMLLVK